MQFPQEDVRQLLKQDFEQIESIWDADPYNEVNVYALTIKEFMQTYEITDVDEGIDRFISFKAKQSNELSIVGLGSDEPEYGPTNPLVPLNA